MTILAFIPDPESAPSMVAWAEVFAESDEETRFVCYEAGSNGRTTQALIEALGEKIGTVPSPEKITGPAPVREVLKYVRKTGARLLLTAPFSLPAAGRKAQTSDELLRSAPCQSFATLYGSKAPGAIKRILLVLSTGPHDQAALRLVDDMRERLDAEVTIGYVEDESGATPLQFGLKGLRARVHEAAVEEDAFAPRVVVDRLKHRGIITLFEDHDLVVTAWDFASNVRPLKQSLGDATVAVVKRAQPLRRGSLVDWVPKINPSDLADLTLNLRWGSRWGPDFIGMLGLASTIASLGLLQNSPAVVIGSMLLAPLMTPMIGLGLALRQENLALTRICGKSILLGFLLTLTISLLLGLIIPAGSTLPDEVLARGGPNVLDLLIAVAAAAAATFAMARPNITGAVAGVAIATALVPPVCSAGIALAHGEPLVALGATLLFFTNLIAIIVTSNTVFLILGVTSSRALLRHRRLIEATRLVLILLMFAIAGLLSLTLHSQLREGKNVEAAWPVTKAVRNALFQRVGEDEGIEIMYLARPRAENRVLIQLASQRELPISYADELRKIVHEITMDPETDVTVIAVRGMWRSDHDSSQSGSQ